MIGVQRMARISVARAIGQYWPYVRTSTRASLPPRASP
jgi:hypothetical protein